MKSDLILKPDFFDDGRESKAGQKKLEGGKLAEDLEIKGGRVRVPRISTGVVAEGDFAGGGTNSSTGGRSGQQQQSSRSDGRTDNSFGSGDG